MQEATKDQDKEQSEPQNPLTERFTEKEWEALKVFRGKLHHICGAAFPEKENKLAPFNLWGVPIDPSNPVGDARVSVVLMKFLRARELNVENATDMMISTLKWREEFKMDELANDESLQEAFSSVGHIFGKDKDGRPVTYNIYGGPEETAATFADVPKFLRWRVQLMERGIAAIDFVNVDSMIQIHDHAGATLSSRTANTKAAATQATTIFQDHYPEFLFKKFYINVPTLMAWIFWLFKPIISATTLAKLNVVGSGTTATSAALLPFIDPKELPKRYGGGAEAF